MKTAAEKSAAVFICFFDVVTGLVPVTSIWEALPL